jgi:hypothetical protein
MMTREEFWRMADDGKLRDEYAANDNLRWLRTATGRELHEIFLEYRVFTIYFADDLSLLVAKMPLGRLKSLMAKLVNEELGEGDPDLSHIKLLEDFIVSLGVAPERLTQPTNADNLQLLHVMRDLLLSKPNTYGVALRGMGVSASARFICLRSMSNSGAIRSLKSVPNRSTGGGGASTPARRTLNTTA